MGREKRIRAEKFLSVLAAAHYFSQACFVSPEFAKHSAEGLIRSFALAFGNSETAKDELVKFAGDLEVKALAYPVPVSPGDKDPVAADQAFENIKGGKYDA
jgi:hypothetical protein